MGKLSPKGEGRVRENRSPWALRACFEPDLHDYSVRLRRTFTLTPAPLPRERGSYGLYFWYFSDALLERQHRASLAGTRAD
jgi:hypothetical protein